MIKKEKTFMEMIKENTRYANHAYDMCNYTKTKWNNWAKKQGEQNV